MLLFTENSKTWAYGIHDSIAEVSSVHLPGDAEALLVLGTDGLFEFCGSDPGTFSKSSETTKPDGPHGAKTCKNHGHCDQPWARSYGGWAFAEAWCHRQSSGGGRFYCQSLFSASRIVHKAFVSPSFDTQKYSQLDEVT